VIFCIKIPGDLAVQITCLYNYLWKEGYAWSRSSWIFWVKVSCGWLFASRWELAWCSSLYGWFRQPL